MIDLHLHLDGSLPPALVLELAKEQGVELPGLDQAGVRRLLSVPEDCESLNDYLRCFDLPLKILQSEEALDRAAYELGRTLGEQGLLYAEVRFAPQLHGARGLSQGRAVEAARRGLQRAVKERPGFSAQLILCCMLGGRDEENRETVRVAEKYLGSGVCAADLAGAEALYPTENYRELFAGARALGVPFTIHAGEAAGPQSVREAISMGAARIGHGVRSLEDPELLSLLAESRIPLELCYTSNLQTKAVSSPEAFPLRQYLRQGICATLNTDNLTVSQTTLRGEYGKLEALGLTEEEESALMKNAVEAAFLSEDGKARLWEQVRLRTNERNQARS